MRARRSFLALLLALALAVTGCGGGDKGDGAAPDKGKAPSASENDLNAVPRDQLADGGTLKWALAQMPPNFNYHHLNGTLKDTADVIGALMPSMFISDAKAELTLNKDYVESAELTSTTPKQVVTYRISPQARWDDGKPITWADFEAQWKALNGTNPAYEVSSTNGYEKMESVVQGRDDHEVVVTYREPYADWKGLFGPLFPSATNADPNVFNTGWTGGVLMSAGPFKFESVDQTAKTITVVRNEKWWGKPAKLDRIIFRVIDPDAEIDALANGEIDFIDVGPDVNKLQRAQSTPGVALRKAGGPNFRHITINGQSAVLKDVKVRKAFGLAINRETVAKAMLGPLGVPASPLNNHIFMANQKGYRDNAGDLGRYDPDKAAALLDEAGWRLEGGVRKKEGRELAIRFVIPSQVATSKQEAELVQGMLKETGIKVNIETVPIGDFFEKYVNPGNFDVTVFSWIGTVFPISSSKSIYAKPKPTPDGGLDVQQNYARVGSDEIDRLYDRATAEFDSEKAIDLGNQIDAMIWDEVHSLTLYQRPDIVAAKATLGNFGAFGFASYIYEDIGFVKA